MSEYPGHKYSIDYDFLRTKPKRVHYVGRIYVHSEQDIPKDKFHEILDEVKSALPEGLEVDSFLKRLDITLEEKGFRRFLHPKDHGLIGEIKYIQETLTHAHVIE